MTSEPIPVKLDIRSAPVRQEVERLVHRVPGFLVLQADDLLPAEILVFEIGSDPQGDFEHLHALLNSGTIGDVFLTSDRSDPSILLQALKIGVREFFPQPIQDEEIVKALERFKNRLELSDGWSLAKPGRIISVLGGKGGVGTTTVAVNLAAQLMAMLSGQSVAILDMKNPFGEVPLFLDVESEHHWGEIASEVYRLDSTYLMSVLARHPSGLCVMPSPNYMNGHAAAEPDAMEQLMRLMRSLFDFIIVDAGQALDELSLKVLQMSDMLLLVSILNVPCLANVNLLLRTFHELGYPAAENIKIVINREESDLSLKDVERSLNKKVFWRLPNDYRSTMSAINEGKPLMDVAPSAKITKSMNRLAQSVAGDKYKKRKKASLLMRFLQKRRRSA